MDQGISPKRGKTNEFVIILKKVYKNTMIRALRTYHTGQDLRTNIRSLVICLFFISKIIYTKAEHAHDDNNNNKYLNAASCQ